MRLNAKGTVGNFGGRKLINNKIITRNILAFCTIYFLSILSIGFIPEVYVEQFKELFKEVDIEMCKLYILFYADDIVLMTDHEVDLQSYLDTPHN